MRFSFALSAITVAGAPNAPGYDGPVDSLVTATSHPPAVMGTACTLTVVLPPAKKSSAPDALAKAEAALRRIEAMMSDYRPDSEVGRLKAAPASQRVALSLETVEVLRSARHFAEVSGGAFDVTAAPLFQLWKRCGRLNRLPTGDELAAARAASSWDALMLLPDGAVKARPLVEVDLGGIAKGYGIDKAVESMKETGCAGGLVEVGGDLRCFGTKPGGDPWRIAVRSPSGPPFTGVLELTSAAVCTSGDYLRFVEIEGKRYSHIVDPRSGMPVDNIPSVTVIASDTTTADALATAISVLGPAKGLDLARRFKGAECLLMIRGSDGTISLYRTEGFPPLVQQAEGHARFGRLDGTRDDARTDKNRHKP
jgi:FAD:protein FMN transferase